MRGKIGASSETPFGFVPDGVGRADDGAHGAAGCPPTTRRCCHKDPEHALNQNAIAFLIGQGLGPKRARGVGAVRET